LLQCIHFVVRNGFFAQLANADAPALAVPSTMPVAVAEL